jgi:dTDP-4-amino-4,6-dideoxygalactose transaminase
MLNPIRLSRSCLGEEEKQAVSQVIEEGYLGMGQQVMLFEQELEAFFSHKVKVACVNTGTSALQLALQACTIGQGDEVIIPSITYVASFQAASATGAQAVACDINLETGCLDIQEAKKKITKRTKAIMYVHYAGGVGDRKGIFTLAKEHGLRVIEDAAHAFGGYNEGQRIGIDGDIVCFSFDGIKNITCGEGGAVVSRDASVIEKVRDFRLLGVKKDSEKRYAGQRSWDFDVEDQGWRYHMSNINAAIGRVQLKKINAFGKIRQNLAKLYKRELGSLPIQFLNLDFDAIIPHIFPVLIPPQKREDLQATLSKNKIETGLHYKPNHLLTKFKSSSCPVAEHFGASVLSLPLHASLTEQTVTYVTQVITNHLSNNQ